MTILKIENNDDCVYNCHYIMWKVHNYIIACPYIRLFLVGPHVLHILSLLVKISQIYAVFRLQLE